MRRCSLKAGMVPSHTSVLVPVSSGQGICAGCVPCSTKVVGLLGKRCDRVGCT